MYWIYLILFVAIVFVPDFVKRGFWGLEETVSEELLLFFFALISFAIFLIREKQLSSYKQGKMKSQRDVNQLTKDLTGSYSYIGETNRKLDILKSIMLGIPAGGEMNAEKEKEILHSIIQAAHILAKSNRIILRFKKEGCGTIKELKSSEGVSFDMDSEKERLCERSGSFFENDDCIVFASPKHADGWRAYLIILKDISHRSIEDPDILKTLAAYASLVFAYCQGAKKASGKKKY